MALSKEIAPIGGVPKEEAIKIAVQSASHNGVLLAKKVLESQDWLDARQHGPAGDREYTIGGSDVGTVLGFNTYKTPIELWEEKKGIKAELHKTEKEKIEQEELFNRGHKLEPYLAIVLRDELEEEYGKGNVLVHADKFTYGCADKNPDGSFKYPYMIVNYDCIIKINHGDGNWKAYLGEIKTLNANDFDKQRDWKHGIVPITYDYQCRYYMKALDFDGAFIICGWGFDRDDRAWTFIERDKAIEEEMLASCDDFIQSLVDDKPLNPDDSPMYYSKLLEYYEAKYPIRKGREKKETIELSDRYRSAIEGLLAIDEKLIRISESEKQLLEDRNRILADLYPIFKEHTNGSYQLNDRETVYIKRKPSYRRDSFDEERFKADHPNLFDEYSDIKLDVAALKKKTKTKTIAANYVIPGEQTEKGTFSISLYDKELHVYRQRKEAPDGVGYIMAESNKLK
ncbi:putative phage-related endonuclease [Lachnospiraceae bacterium PF1-22]